MEYLTKFVDAGDFFYPIPGFPNHEISLRGRVRNRNTGRVLATRVKPSSRRYYLRCSLGLIHRLLMAAVIRRPLTDDEQVRHIDNNSRNNALANLRIGSAKQNRADRLAADTYGSKLRILQVREIRALAGHFSLKHLAAHFRVSIGHIRRIISRQSWGALA